MRSAMLPSTIGFEAAMIRFQLQCKRGHGFDGWFASNDAFETQAKRGLIDCPHCGDTAISKGLMAPSVVTGRRKAARAEAVDTEPSAADASFALSSEQAEAMAKLRELARQVRANTDHVGRQFAEEARKIHFGETEHRAIHGEASADEVRGLLEDGVPIAPLPALPEDLN
jgi:hypothetical protein